MPKITLEDILETIPDLTPDEQRQVRRKAESVALNPPSDEALFAKMLMSKGLVTTLPSGENRDAAHVWQPVLISEKSLSEVILEEKR